jgi:hypothetical protein
MNYCLDLDMIPSPPQSPRQFHAVRDKEEPEKRGARPQLLASPRDVSEAIVCAKVL